MQARTGLHGILRAGWLVPRAFAAEMSTSDATRDRENDEKPCPHAQWLALSAKDSSLYIFKANTAADPEARVRLAEADLGAFLDTDNSANNISSPSLGGFRLDLPLLDHSVEYIAFTIDEANDWLKDLQEYAGARWVPDTGILRDLRRSFDRFADTSGRVSGSRASDVFSEMGQGLSYSNAAELSPEVIGRIWSLADRDDDHRLSRPEFVAALALFIGARQGWTLPQALPSLLIWAAWENEPRSYLKVPDVTEALRAADPIVSPTGPRRGAVTPPVAGYGAMPTPGSSNGGGGGGGGGGVTRYGATKISSVLSGSSPQNEAHFSTFPPGIGINGLKTSGLQPLSGKYSGLTPPSDLSKSTNQVSAERTASFVPFLSPGRHSSNAVQRADRDPLIPPVVTPAAAAAAGYAAVGPVVASNFAVSSNVTPSSASGTAPYGTVIPLNGDPTTTPDVGDDTSHKSRRSSSSRHSRSNSSSNSSSRSQGHARHGSRSARWVECQAPDGRLFYYDEVSKQSLWDRPSDFELSCDGGERKNEKSNLTSDLPLPLDSSARPDAEGYHVLDTLADPTKFEFFRQFLDAEGVNADLLFYTDATSWRLGLPSSGLPLSADVVRAKAIYDTFLSTKGAIVPELTSVGYVSGSESVVLRDKTKEEIKDSLRAAEKNSRPLPSSLFETACLEVLTRMQAQQFPKFMKSMMYLTMYNCISSQRNAYELPQALWDDFVFACDGGVEEGWISEGTIKGVEVETKNFSGDPLVYVRGTGVVSLPPDEAYKFAVSTDLRKLWDPKTVEARILQRLDPTTVIFYIAYRPPKWASFMNNHDFVVLRTERRLPDGTILVLSRSIGHSDAPLRKNHNRGEMHCGGFCLRPVGTNKTSVIYVNQVEMHGIPKWAEKRYVLQRAMLINSIRKFIEKQQKREQKGGAQPAWKNPNLDVNKTMRRHAHARTRSQGTPKLSAIRSKSSSNVERSRSSSAAGQSRGHRREPSGAEPNEKR